MLRSFHVKNWRDFNSLSIEGLSRVNLIVGPHSVGKTALVEAIWLYHQRFATSEVHRLLAARDEHQLLPDAAADAPPLLRLEALLHRRGAGERALSLQSDAGTLTAHLLLSDEVVTLWNTGAFTDLEILCRQVAQRGDATHRWQLRWEAAQEGVHGLPPLLAELPSPPPEPTQGDLFAEPVPPPPAFAPGAFLHPHVAEVEAQEQAWDALTQPPHAAEVLRSLQRLEPRIKRLTLYRTAQRTLPLVSLARDPTPIPLRSFGEGATWLLTLHRALIQSKNGILILDGLIQGFHANMQAHVWELILTRAAALNVQVFAVTHSLDCARVLAAASESCGEEAALVRLSRLRGVLQVETGGVAALQTVAARELAVR